MASLGVLNPLAILLYLASIAIGFQFDFLFDGAYRYFVLRFFLFVTGLVFLLRVLGSLKFKITSMLGLNVIFLVPILLLLIWSTSVYLDQTLISRTFANFLIVFCPIVLLMLVKDKVSFLNLKTSLFLTIFFVLFYLSIEGFFRFFYPTLDVSESHDPEKIMSFVSNFEEGNVDIWSIIFDGYYYQFKYSSVMFYDSNYAGLLSVFIFVVSLFYRRNLNEKAGLVFIIWAFLLTLISLSKAAIFSMFIVIFALWVLKLISSRRFFSAFFVSLMSFSFALFLGVLLLDLFQSKIEIYASIVQKNDLSFLEYLFGKGFVVGGYVYSYQQGAYAHALLPLLLGEVGFLGMFIYHAFAIYFMYRLGSLGLLVFLSTILPGLSLFDPYQPIYFWCLGLMFIINQALDKSPKSGVAFLPVKNKDFVVPRLG